MVQLKYHYSLPGQHSDSGSQLMPMQNGSLISLNEFEFKYDAPGGCIWERLHGAYADRTIRAYQSDFNIFSNWCETVNLSAVPTTPDTIAAFISFETDTLAPATIRRRIISIGRVHRLSELPDPTNSETVRLALRRMHRKKGRRQKQAFGLTSDLRDQLIAATSNDLKGCRDRALVSLAYDTLRRRSELVALRVDDLEPIPQGGAIILVRRSKTDQEGSGKLAYVSSKTLEYCSEWIKQANIDDGLILRSVTQSGIIRDSLYPGSISRIFKKLAANAGLSESCGVEVFGWQICIRLHRIIRLK